MNELTENIYRFVNSVLILLVAQAWMLLLPMTLPENGEPSAIMWWLGGNVLLINMEVDDLSEVPNPATILLYAGMAPVFVFVYMDLIIRGFLDEDSGDE